VNATSFMMGQYWTRNIVQGLIG